MMSAGTILTQSRLAQSQGGAQMSAATRLTNQRSDASPTEQRAAAVEFEQFFIAQMLEHMFAGVPTDGPFGGGNGESILRSLLHTEYAKITIRSGALGIADPVYRDILTLQERKTSIPSRHPAPRLPRSKH